MKKFVKILCFLAAISFILQGCANKNNNENPTETEASVTSWTSISEKTEKSEKQESTTTTTATAALSPYSEMTEGNIILTTSASSSVASTTKATTAATKKKVAAPTYKNGIMIVNKTYALPSGYNPGVNSEAQNAFNTMASAASEENIKLYIVSGFRSYSTQESIYNNYVATDGKAAADRYSARPGHSEHQTGLAFDVNSLSQSFENTPEGKWLAANCHKYGFIIRYPKGKESITGYMYEPWHIRYLGKENAQKVFKSGKTLEEYLGVTSSYSN